MKSATITRTLKGLLGAAAMFSATTLCSAQQVSGNLKYFQATKPAECSYTEANTFYSLPGGINGYTFMDVYGDRTSSGKTTLSKKTGEDNISLIGRIVHSDEPLTEAGIGFQNQVNLKNGYFSVNLIPFFFDKEGNHESGRMAIEYCFGRELGRGFNLEAFGDWMINHGKTSWDYGEIELTKKFGKHLKIGYSGALCSHGNSVMPKLQHRAVVRWDFSFGSNKK
jgi:hypothetical protein